MRPRRVIDSDALGWQLKAAGVEYEQEYRFVPKRRFRADYRMTGTMWLVEIEGGVWTGGRHTSPVGYQKDMEKYNLAAMLGYKVLRFTPQQVDDGTALDTILKAIGGGE